MTKTKKSKNKKVVLASALLLAGVIAVGGTFAWFTSKNQVTNRLTASNSYGVSITESFTPPEQWTPGQNIDKEVAAVNTGNVAAYVKLDLTDEMSVTAETGVPVSTMIDGQSTVLSTITSDDSYVVLSEDEVISIEAGGQLAYVNGLQKVVTTTTDAVTGEVTETITYKIKDTTTVVDTTVTAGEYYKTITTSGLYVFARTDLDKNKVVYSGYYVVVSGSDKTFYKVDLSGLTLTETETSPSTDGNEKTTVSDIVRGDFNIVKEETTPLTADGSSLLFSYAIFNSSTTYNDGFAPYGNGYISTDLAYYIQAVYDPDYQTTALDADNGWSDTEPSGSGNVYQKKYTGNKTYYYTDPDQSNNIVINIALDGKWTKTSGSPDYWTSTDWTAVYDSATDDWTFYYNHVLSAGTTSELLVTDMQLDTSVKNDAYTEFTYDLIVNLESVQVVAAETYENGITKIEIPSSSITWTQAVGTSTYDVSETATTGIYVNEDGQVCIKAGTVSDENNNLTWSFSTQ